MLPCITVIYMYRKSLIKIYVAFTVYIINVEKTTAVYQKCNPSILNYIPVLVKHICQLL